MATATSTTAVVPVEVYLAMQKIDRPMPEYVDGRIVERSVTGKVHEKWRYALVKWFMLHEDEWNLKGFVELHVHVSPTRYRLPDVAILDPNGPDEELQNYPPLAVFEILSPQDTVEDLIEKLNDYQQMGIPQIWMINPKDKVWRRWNAGLLQETTFSLPERGITFEMEEISKLVR